MCSTLNAHMRMHLHCVGEQQSHNHIFMIWQRLERLCDGIAIMQRGE